MDKQKQISLLRNKKRVGQVLEVMIEAKNETRKQWVGRTSQNITLNFSAPEEVTLALGSYVSTRVTAAFPYSLVGELVPEAQGNPHGS